MSDYLNNLLARSRNLSPVVQPRLASLFEPPAVANSGSNRPFFEAEAMREAHAESESSPQLSPLIPTQIGQPAHRPLQATVVVSNAPMEQKRGEGGERYKSREDLSRHSLHPLSTGTPPAPPSLPTQSARPAPDGQPEAGEILRPLRYSTQLPAPRGAEERAETPLTIKANNQENWAGIEPKVRQIVSERLALLQRSQERASDGGEAIAPQQTQASASPVIAQTQDKRPRQPAQTFPVEIAEPSPMISVSIGRVEVRAIISQQPAPGGQRVEQKTGALSLDEYLKQRSGGRQ
jgi:hypothetical protein